MATPHKVTGRVMADHIDRIDDGATEIRRALLEALARPMTDPFEWVALAGQVLKTIDEQVVPGLEDARLVNQGKSR